MNAGIIASRYATALLRLVDETGRGEVVVRQAHLILNALKTLPDLRRLLADTSVPADKKMSLLETAVSEDLSSELRKFFELLIRNGRIGDITLTLKSFEDQFHESRGIVRGRLVLPSASDASGARIEKRLKDLIESKLGKKLQLETEIDESLIGGFVLEIEDRLLDASVSRQLDIIRRQFIEKNRRIV